ncbi:exosortase family protein XrtF [Apibacter adventoris]|uniref:exosortase family protein XrtF n=1 Tax=Apibacter adventoris TaxID=1679466 RepID=UPI000CF727D6|nr:exosortase family protein XrtF [Apibacter adventoris]PQL95752.1 exosortase family protein XrtF [Apibacter adventoris]
MKEYKPILICLLKFFSVYFILISLYNLYLNHYQIQLHTCDPFTKIVAQQSSYLLKIIKINSSTLHINQDNYMLFFINKKLVSIVNEGCNALSIMILYLAFIISFASTWKKTVIYILVTLIILHISNIIRIAFINYSAYFYPMYRNELHDYIFPAIIYGLVILLWIIWINFFVLKSAKNETNN